jgi:hypothetical protein
MKPHAHKSQQEQPPKADSWWIGLSREEFSEKLRLNQPRMTDSKFGQAIFVSATAQKEQR